uniref:Uncharacterized protein n=2 Tax=Oryza sativa subsp. japonica TaxID=39947 RepID=Q53J33_ORYSJ|nr:hypothetical protein LOC_Os11g46890 [Oryza sativa Japonica Group]ABA95432.1 hypothetical protein LOC_Os11g46890 [Oryza sativa Japonica Group]
MRASLSHTGISPSFLPTLFFSPHYPLNPPTPSPPLLTSLIASNSLSPSTQLLTSHTYPILATAAAILGDSQSGIGVVDEGDGSLGQWWHQRGQQQFPGNDGGRSIDGIDEGRVCNRQTQASRSVADNRGDDSRTDNNDDSGGGESNVGGIDEGRMHHRRARASGSVADDCGDDGGGGGRGDDGDGGRCNDDGRQWLLD